MWIENGQHEGFWQELVPEHIPKYCTHCFHQGHDMEGCHVLQPDLRPIQLERKMEFGQKQMEFHPKEFVRPDGNGRSDMDQRASEDKGKQIVDLSD